MERREREGEGQVREGGKEKGRRERERKGKEPPFKMSGNGPGLYGRLIAADALATGSLYILTSLLLSY